MKTLGGTTELNQSQVVSNDDPEEPVLASSAMSTEIFAFGEQVVSPSSSKQRKLGDLRSLVNQIKEQDNDHADTITGSTSSGAGGGGEMGVSLASSISIIILLFCIIVN